jgi:5-(carboxyamino)imidazole ribonucleotide mutase
MRIDLMESASTFGHSPLHQPYAAADVQATTPAKVDSVGKTTSEAMKGAAVVLANLALESSQTLTSAQMPSSLVQLLLHSWRYAAMAAENPLVGVIMGSKSDWEHMIGAADILNELKVAHEIKILSAHRTPDLTLEYSASAKARGLRVIIAGAGGAAHLAGVVAAKTILPVIGVPMPTTSLNGMDSLLSIVQMPRGIPVATMAIGKAGAGNAGLLACAIIALSDEALADRLSSWRAARVKELLEQRLP